ncbi:MAG: cytidine deaminase [Acholeplasmatales bacterium]|jgi:cytidine deaminase|nr:cytidine deaminase [Acholeplasmatales bacterium]
MNELKLIDEAILGRKRSYSPYSKFKVGAAILLKNGSFIHGCNIENVSYGLSNCAERTALFKMVSEGYSKEDVVAMAIVADTTLPVSPCGACRQVMAELLKKETKVILANMKKEYKMTTVEELLPYSFEEIENAN